MQHISHCLFDMDGLLLNTEEIFALAQQQVLNLYGKEFTWEVKVMVSSSRRSFIYGWRASVTFGMIVHNSHNMYNAKRGLLCTVASHLFWAIVWSAGSNNGHES